MSDVKKRCAACRKEKPVSEMKVCMHSQMHYYVCDSKCMHDFYNPPKAEKTGHDAAIAALQSRLDAAETERDQLRAELSEYQADPSYATACETIRKLRAELEAIRGQQPVATVHSGKYASGMPWLEVEWHVQPEPPAGTKLYALPPRQPDAVSVPSDTALRRAAKFLAGIDNGCNEVKTLRALVANAQASDAVSVPRELLERICRMPLDYCESIDLERSDAMQAVADLLSTKNAE